MKEEGFFKSKKVLCTVNGMDILEDTVYEVVGKFDAGAPMAFQENNIAKMPFADNCTYVSCPWDNNSNVFNTGFYRSSLCYRGEDKVTVDKMLSDRINNIMRPYEEFCQNDLSQGNLDFWDKISVPLYMNKIFNTSDIAHLFELYICVHSCMLTPSELDGDPTFINSMFCVNEKNASKNHVAQREINKMNIGYKVVSAINKGGKDRQSVLDLMMFMGIVLRDDVTEDDYYIGSLANWISSRPTNVDQLMDVWERYMNTGMYEILKFNRILNRLVKSGIVKSSHEGVMYDGWNLGPDIKSSAESLSTDKSLVDAKISILEEYDRVSGLDGILVRGKARDKKVIAPVVKPKDEKDDLDPITDPNPDANTGITTEGSSPIDLK